VEIIRGPASALFGADAFLGVVNIVTRGSDSLHGADLRAGLSPLMRTAGSDLDGALGTTLGGVEVAVFLRYQNEDRSGLQLPASSPAPLVPGDRNESSLATRTATTALLKLRYSAATWNAQLNAYLSALDTRAEFSPWAQLSNGVDRSGRSRENRVDLLQGQVSLRAQRFFTPDLDVTLDAIFFSAGVQPNDRLEVGSDVYYVRRHVTSRGLDGSLEGRWRPLPSLTLVVGAGLLLDREQLPAYERVLKLEAGTAPAGSVVEATRVDQGWRNFLSPAVYGQVLWTPFERYLRLIGGLRYDQHNIYGDQVSGRVGAVSQPLDSLHVKVLWGSAFKAPSPWLLYARPYRSGDVVGNPGLKPQRVQTVEGELAFKPVAWFSASTALSYNYLQNKAEFASEGVNLVARNLAEADSLSWETRLEARYQRFVSGYLSFEKQFMSRRSGDEGYRAELVGEINEGAPEAIVRAGITGEYAPWHLRLALEGAYVGAREASAINALLAGGRYKLDPYFLADATLTVFGLRLFPGGYGETSLLVAARNLLDARAADPGYSGVDYPLARRGLELSLRQTF
jgi:iron complex outermembrane receptor protein